MRYSRVAVLGYGRFGSAMCELCLRADLGVRALDIRAEVPASMRAHSLAEFADGADVVVIAVPVSGMEHALQSLVPHLSSSQLVVDVGSVKSGPVATMRLVLGTRVPWAGTHPLFGPTSLALGKWRGRVVVCPNDQHPRAAKDARALYEQIGCDVMEQDAEAHDRGMAKTHALVSFVASGLVEVDAREACGSPWFRAIMRTMATELRDVGDDFLFIQSKNPYSEGERRRLLDALLNIDEKLIRRADALRDTGPDVDACLVHAKSPGTIPHLGTASPDLVETRDRIDAIDRDIVDLLARRAGFARHAGDVKGERGLAVHDPDRERSLLTARGNWASEQGLDADAVRGVFEAILRFSRSLQTR